MEKEERNRINLREVNQKVSYHEIRMSKIKAIVELTFYLAVFILLIATRLRTSMTE